MESSIFNSKRLGVYLVPTFAWLMAKYGVVIDENTQVQMTQMIDTIYALVTGILLAGTKILDNWKANKKKPKFKFTDLIFFWKLFKG